MAEGRTLTIEGVDSDERGHIKKKMEDGAGDPGKRTLEGTTVGEASLRESDGCTEFGWGAALATPERKETATGKRKWSEPLLGEGNVRETVAWLESCLEAEVVRWNSEALRSEAAEADAAVAYARAEKAEAEVMRLRQVLAKKAQTVGEAMAVAEEASERAEEAEKRAEEAKAELDAGMATVKEANKRAEEAYRRAERVVKKAEEANKLADRGMKRGKGANGKAEEVGERNTEVDREINELSRQLGTTHERAKKAEKELVDVGKQRDEACKRAEEAERRAKESDERGKAARLEAEAGIARTKEADARAEEAQKRAAEVDASLEEADRRADEADERAEEVQKKAEEANRAAKEAIAKAAAVERALGDEVARRTRAETSEALAKANAKRLARELDTVVASIAGNRDTPVALKKEVTRMRLLLFERSRAADKAVVRADEADVRAEKGEARAEEARGKAEEARRIAQEAAWRADDANMRAADMERIVAEEVARRLRAEAGEAVARQKADDLAKQLGRVPCLEQLEADAAVAKIRAGVLETELAGMRGSLVEKIEEAASAREKEANARRRKAEARVAVLEFARAEEVSRRERAESAAAQAETRPDELAEELEETTVPTTRNQRLHGTDSKDVNECNVTSGQSDSEGVRRVSPSDPSGQLNGGGGAPVKQGPHYKAVLALSDNQCSNCKKRWSFRWYAPLEDTFRLLCNACYEKERNAGRCSANSCEAPPLTQVAQSAVTGDSRGVLGAAEQREESHKPLKAAMAGQVRAVRSIP